MYANIKRDDSEIKKLVRFHQKHTYRYCKSYNIKKIHFKFAGEEIQDSTFPPASAGHLSLSITGFLKFNAELF